MSRPANPYDNARCESFLKTLKQEEIYVREYGTLEQLQANVEEFIEQYYNRLRLHSALGYRPPEEFEQQVERQNQTADLNVAAVILRFGKSSHGDARRSGDHREPERAQP
jgi:hypothetical protein